MRARLVIAPLALGALALAQAPHSPAAAPPATPARVHDPIAALRDLEDTYRRTTDFAALPPGDRVTGPDPVDLVEIPGRSGLVAVLAGADALVVLDADGGERQRLPVPGGAPAAVAAGLDGSVFVTPAAGAHVQRLRVLPDGRLERTGTLELGGLCAVTDLAVGPEGVLYAVEDYDGRLLAVPTAAPARARGSASPPASPAVREFGRCHGPARVVRADDFVLVDCLLDHEVRVYRVDAAGLPAGEPAARLRTDGPIWSLAAARAGDRLVVALGGVEDHALDRQGGGFGYIDSFVFVHELALADLAPVRPRRDVNVSALGVVTPKWIAVDALADGSIEIATAGFGSDRRVELRFAPGQAEPTSETWPMPPGTVALVRRGDGFIAASTLLDAWVVGRAGAFELVAIPEPTPAGVAAGAARTLDSRVGELLFFTTLMAPFNPGDGPKSRFTCETCHHEGYGDGRVHFTGRDTVHATARPLRSLASNRPHFSRALDRTMADMVHAEFRVANHGSGRSAWFAVDAALVPWLAQVPGAARVFTPLDLRRAFMRFLMEFTHEANPAVAGATPDRGFTDEERRGAEVFRDRCEACHAARLVADEPASQVPFARWEALVLAPTGAIVWGAETYHRTGIEPYVHERGARAPSLRRVYRRFPLFTSGSAADLPAVLAGARAPRDPAAGDAASFRHAGDGPGLVALPADEQVALLSFLRLL